MYTFHKKLHEERILITNPALLPVAVGSVITRFGYRILIKMNSLTVAETILLTQQFSFGIKRGGVKQGILANPLIVEIDMDLKNAHTFISRDKTEEDRTRERHYFPLPSQSFQVPLWQDCHPPMALRGWP
jgi:hypothetical protein